MITLGILMAIAAPPTHSGVSYDVGKINVSSVPYVVKFGSCFEANAIATFDATAEARQNGYEKCKGARPAILQAAANNSTAQDRGRLKSSLERAFNIIEKAYGDALFNAAPASK